MAKRILAVDDEPSILQLVKLNMERAGYEVTTASNGRAALEAVSAGHPDLIIMDVMMPEIDGLEALRILKNDAATSSIPVIMLTANGEDADVMRGWQSGAHAYLSKPFNLRELLVFVKSVLDEESGSNDKTYNIVETN